MSKLSPRVIILKGVTANYKKRILGYVNDLVTDFLYYNRKEDEDLPLGVIEEAVSHGDITIKEMANEFERALKEKLE